DDRQGAWAGRDAPDRLLESGNGLTERRWVGVGEDALEGDTIRRVADGLSRLPTCRHKIRVRRGVGDSVGNALLEDELAGVLVPPEPQVVPFQIASDHGGLDPGRRGCLFYHRGE